MKQEIPTTPPRRPPPRLPKSSPAATMTVCASGLTPTSHSHSQSRTPSRTIVSPNSDGGSPKKAIEKLSSGRVIGTAVQGSDRTRTRIVRAPATHKTNTRKPPVPLNNDVECGIPNRVEQRRRRGREGVGGGVVKENGGHIDAEKEELRRKVVELEILMAGLKEEVLGLKSELEDTRQLNADLQAVNGKLSEDLANAEAKIVGLTPKPDESSKKGEFIEECIISKTESNINFIAQELEDPQGDKRVLTEKQGKSTSPTTILPHKTPAASAAAQCPSQLPPPPPPPPPTPPRLPVRANAPCKPPPVVELYQSLAKREGNKNAPGHMNQYGPAHAHISIVGEIENRSSHLLAIKADINSKGEFINDLIQRVVTAAYLDIEDLSRFVSWLDSQLSTLADERAVLKHFRWPERKADAMREAAIEYRCLKSLEYEISSYTDDVTSPCGIALKKISNLLDKLERGIQGMVRLRTSVMPSYQSYKIPFDWMLDSGLVGEIKRASTKLGNLYLRRVITEVQCLQNSDRESTQEALLLQGVHFAYRIHQFAGELDSEAMCAFEEIKQRVPLKPGGGSAVVFAASVPSF